jgi:hypothetical protein
MILIAYKQHETQMMQKKVAHTQTQKEATQNQEHGQMNCTYSCVGLPWILHMTGEEAGQQLK